MSDETPWPALRRFTEARIGLGRADGGHVGAVQGSDQICARDIGWHRVGERPSEQARVEVSCGVHVGLLGIDPASDPGGIGAFIGHWRRLSFISKVMRTIVMSAYVHMRPC